MLVFAHISTSTTANEGFNIDEVNNRFRRTSRRSLRPEPTPKPVGLHLKTRLRLSHKRGPLQMATSTTPQPDTVERPENSTTSVDANKIIPRTGWR